MSCLKKLAMSAALIAIFSAGVRADTLWIGDNNTDCIKADGVKVQPVTDGERLPYVTDAGMQATKTFTKLQKINIDGETNFNAAEDAYFKGDMDAAITKYQALLQGSTKPWMQKRAATRLLVAGKAKNRYDAQVTAYVALLSKDPALAADNKPSEPVSGMPNMEAALTAITKGLDNSKLDSAQKSSLLSLQLKIDQARGDSAGAQSTLQQLVALGGGNDAMKATLKLNQANVALSNKQYPQAIADIEQNKAIFIEPSDQVDALWVLAMAKNAVDGEKTDEQVQKDLALNFMRVVTFGSQLPEHPHVAESLDYAAQIEIKLKDPTAALTLYQQLVRDKATAPAALVAKANTQIAALIKETGAK